MIQVRVHCKLTPKKMNKYCFLKHIFFQVKEHPICLKEISQIQKYYIIRKFISQILIH